MIYSTNNMRQLRTLLPLKLPAKWRLFLLTSTAIAFTTLYILWSSSTSSSIAPRPKTILIYNNEHLCSANTSLVKSTKHRRHQTTIKSATPSEISIVIVIPSRRKNFVQRNLIRQTYGSIRNVNNVHILAVVFIVGSKDNPRDFNNYSDKLDAERIQFGDVIMGDLVDTYRNLTRKSVLTYDWLTAYCSEADLVVKTDDDVVVDIFKLTAELSRWKPTEPFKFWCGVHYNERVIRDPTSMYYVSREEFAFKRFPKHCAGLGYVTSMHLVRRIADEISKSFHGPICTHEDAFLTGIVPERINSCGHKPPIEHVNRKKDWVLYVDEYSKQMGGEYIWKVVGEAIDKPVDFGEFRNLSGSRVFYLLQHDYYFKSKFLRLWHLLENSFRNGRATINNGIG